MPCSGPSYPTNEEINEVFEKIMIIFRKDYMFLSEPTPFWKTHREEAKKKLKEGIKEMMFQDRCEGF